jgi:hypothetical protein
MFQSKQPTEPHVQDSPSIYNKATKSYPKQDSEASATPPNKLSQASAWITEFDNVQSQPLDARRNATHTHDAPIFPPDGSGVLATPWSNRLSKLDIEGSAGGLDRDCDSFAGLFPGSDFFGGVEGLGKRVLFRMAGKVMYDDGTVGYDDGTVMPLDGTEVGIQGFGW